LNPWRGYSVPSTSPYKSTPLAIPHCSAGGLDFLIEDFHAAFIRRMGGNPAGAVVRTPIAHAAFGDAQSKAACAIEFVDDGSCELEIKYFRLAHTRALKESYRFNVWQAQTFLGPQPPAVTVANESGHALGRMKCVGKDPNTSADGVVGSSSIAYNETDATWDVQFATINLAQVPSFLLISAPRLNSEYSLSPGLLSGGVDEADTVQTAAAGTRNKSANLFIKSIKVQVNNAQGHLDRAGGENEAFITSERLFEMTRENAGSHYFQEGGFREWRDKQMAVLLSSAQFAPGLMVSDGVAYPINIDIILELQNRHVDVSAAGIQGGAVHRAVADKIRAQAQATAIFTKIILSTTETSATTNAMNYPLDSAERILNSAGSMR